MKTFYTAFLILFFVSNVSKAQATFWTEDFGTACLPRASLATSYVGPNGAWTETSTGTNEEWGNEFYINDRIAYTGIGNCATGNDLGCTTNNNCLHIGGKAILTEEPADSSSYWTGFFGSAATNLRIESPVINCTGKSNISLSFIYYEGGDHANGDPDGDATLVYYDGSTWAKISDLVKLPDFTTGNARPVCTGTEYGPFGTFSINLPASANNNPSVKIGFTWTNNDAGTGTDPSFAVDSIQLSVFNPPVANFQSSKTTLCVSDCINFTDLSTGATAWLWSFAGGTPSSSTDKNPQNICYSASGSFDVKLIVSNPKGTDSVTSVNYITVNPAPAPPVINTSTGGTTFCAGSSLVLTSSASNGNKWSTGAGTQSITVASPGTYSVVVTGSDNCKASDSIVVAGLPPADSVPICMVTVDSLSQNNIIIWTKTHPSPLDSFIVYREITTDNYQPIGAVPDIGALSEFIDTVRTKYFPNTGDPNGGSYRYKLQIRDTCDNYSSLSPYHNTIYVSNNNNGTFTWAQLYTIEGSPNPVTSYDLLRDDNSNGNWHVVNSVAGTQQSISDPAFNSYKNTASWRVQTVWGITCTPSMRVSSTSSFGSSLSNITGKDVLGITEMTNSDMIALYPNPANNQLAIHSSSFHNEAATVSVMNVLGEILQDKKLKWSGDLNINIKTLPAGIYFLQLKSESGSVVKRFVKE